MAAKDFYHEIVKKALITDGWTITQSFYQDFFEDAFSKKL